MSPSQSAALPIAYMFLRILIVLNWIVGAGIFVLLVGIIVAPNWTFGALAIPHSLEAEPVITGLRAMGVLGLAGIPLNNAVLKRLVAIVVTVRRGDPFVSVNAYRLEAIAWMLFALQLLSLLVGAVGNAISTPAHSFHVGGSFSPAGWLAVILTFVLARIFAEGTLMREDLEGTV